MINNRIIIQNRVGLGEYKDAELIQEIEDRGYSVSQKEKCWSCGKINCTCDEETMQAMENDDEERGER